MSTTTTPEVQTKNPVQQEVDSRILAFARTAGISEDSAREAFVTMGIDFHKPDLVITMFDNDDVITFGDLFKAFVAPGTIKVAMLRMATKHLRGVTEERVIEPTSDISDLAKSIKDMAASARPKNNWTVNELLAVYLTDDEARAIISKRTKGRPCIVFQSNGSLNIPACLELIKIAVNQPTEDTYHFEGSIVRVHRSGIMPVSTLEECPFCIGGKALVNGYCSTTQTNWNGIDFPSRILAHIYVFKVETAKLSIKQLQEVCNDARKGYTAFRNLYPQAALLYDEMETAGTLPKLKITNQSDKAVIDRGC